MSHQPQAISAYTAKAVALPAETLLVPLRKLPCQSVAPFLKTFITSMKQNRYIDKVPLRPDKRVRVTQHIENRNSVGFRQLTTSSIPGLRGCLHEAVPPPDVRTGLDGQQGEPQELGHAGWHPGRRHGPRKVPHRHRSHSD